MMRSLKLEQLEEGSRVENLQAQRCRARLEHLDSVADADKFAEWKDVRLTRILVDYMLRMSYYDTAKKLAETSKIQVSFYVQEKSFFLVFSSTLLIIGIIWPYSGPYVSCT